MQYPEQTRHPIAFLRLAYVCLTVIHLYRVYCKIVQQKLYCSAYCQLFMFCLYESQALIAISYTVHQFDTRDDSRRDDSLLFQDGTDGQRVVGSHLPLNWGGEEGGDHLPKMAPSSPCTRLLPSRPCRVTINWFWTSFASLRCYHRRKLWKTNVAPILCIDNFSIVAQFLKKKL